MRRNTILAAWAAAAAVLLLAEGSWAFPAGFESRDRQQQLSEQLLAHIQRLEAALLRQQQQSGGGANLVGLGGIGLGQQPADSAALANDRLEGLQKLRRNFRKRNYNLDHLARMNFRRSFRASSALNNRHILGGLKK